MRVILCLSCLLVLVPGFAIPLNSSVLMFHMGDVARMKSQIDKAAAMGNRKLNFVVTLHHIADPVTRQMEKLCYLRGDGNPLCHELSESFLRDFEEKLREGFLHAAALGLDISVVPHLDDGLQQGFWRNNLVFDPLAPAGEFSYARAMIWPLARSLLAAARRGSHVEFALQGESGATVFHHASSYRRLARELRDYFNDAPVQLGLSLNFNLVAGTGFHYNEEQIREFRHLLSDIDFLGVSAYGSVRVPPQAENFDRSQQIFLAELAAYGIDVPLEMPLRYSEVGLGGGTLLNDGKTPAERPEDAATACYSGIYGDFQENLDPWRTREMQAFRFDYHLALLEYLAHPELQSRRLISAFLWNANSWDVQGLYRDDQYRDDSISLLIQHANANR